MKRLLSILLALCIAAGLLCAAAVPVYAAVSDEPAFAAVDEDAQPDYWDYVLEYGIIGIVGLGVVSGIAALFLSVANFVITVAAIVVGVLYFMDIIQF